ncbi:hypothetical protein [Mesorhizobium amorphae]|uniref:Uncharacterized protein n=1 Tax=Mesorhizobium amorphae CCNWGS0123 TaxID=1082933 RepID=G6YBP7_9HYPH|nr:hypothetical protein [Mesorhizobium amorphae]ANT49754.1 hypothetical protein A6B35_07280 [Mesorhizobium amorphae CCNWGS0123]EHH10888.1 hypothetical protein MEA186_16867 [Mesorhizobium amorphae CCNWGS0123]GLR40119.1 hypothetical protein GCM10007880_06350 [Mesorhizobium amorphae]
MDGRGFTNLLLAVIAGVLLFGRDAVLSGLKGFVLVAVAIAVIWGALSLALYLIREALRGFREAKNLGDVGKVLFLIALCCIGLPMLAYAGWLWLEGVPNPLNAAASSGIGAAWMVVVALFAAGFVVACLHGGFRWVTRNRSDLPAIAGHRLRLIFWGYLEFLGGPVTFPIRERRIHGQGGSASHHFRMVFAAFIGLIVAAMTALLTLGAVVWGLYEVGLIE